MASNQLNRAGVTVRDQKTISASWDRCRDDYGLDQWRKRSETVVRREQVRDSIETLGPLFSACRSQVEHIFQNIVGSGHAVILTDRSGTIIEFAVQSALEDLFRQSGLRRGADWSEACEGTNGIGTAIREKTSLTIYRDQHFHNDHASLTCTGAPVFDVEGDVLALFDVSSIGRTDDLEILAHTRALLEMSARLITRRNFQDHFADQWILRFHRDVERVGLLEEGLLALDQNGRIIGADEQAIKHLSAPDRSGVVGADIGHLFEVEPGQLADRLAEEGHAPTRLQVHTDYASNHRNIHASLIGPRAGRVKVGSFVSRPNRKGKGPRSKSHTKPHSSDALERLVGQDSQLLSLAKKAGKLLEHDVPLLIVGETGVGKDSFARALHQSSGRADAPFIAVNCGALPENLIEGELFGYKAGAFTGAQASGFKGQVLAANGGTLLLDEIGDMPLSAQTRLLQVLERRQVTPLGSSVGVDLDIRLLAATHQPLEKLCKEGLFREDLYYRICGFTVSLPPLRDRSDLAYLIGRLLPEMDFANQAHFSIAAQAMIRSYDWPGNIRQLKHVLKTASILADGEPVAPEHLQMIEKDETCPTAGQADHSEAQPVLDSRSSALDFSNYEKYAIEQALSQSKWNVSLCASALGLSRNTLYRKMKQHNIRRKN
ncbi:sigma-54-dependent Fis family transcriptional regulator [Cohaesibacter celericrescens]|uniref:sigma-54-dependent Fis family transcriptional regulator n=1 Tax=Cohaesibacter celericrescens TaxID=2067669 RepID=UPI0015E084FD|nr:sigma-54-dependent Fis family transcriptional regulator [Cohaesibacter celericrescens]